MKYAILISRARKFRQVKRQPKCQVELSGRDIFEFFDIFDICADVLPNEMLKGGARVCVTFIAEAMK